MFEIARTDVGARARALRNERGYTQPELAEQLGWGQWDVSRFESGKVVTETRSTDIARFFGVSLGWLLFGDNAYENVRVSNLEEEIELTKELIDDLKLQLSFLEGEKIPWLKSLSAEMKSPSEWSNLDPSKTLYVVEGGTDSLDEYLIEARLPDESKEDGVGVAGLDSVLIWPDSRLTSYVQIR